MATLNKSEHIANTVILSFIGIKYIVPAVPINKPCKLNAYRVFFYTFMELAVSKIISFGRFFINNYPQM